jgi:hypothetical protein
MLSKRFSLLSGQFGLAALLSLSVAQVGCGGTDPIDPGPDLFEPKPECTGAPVTPLGAGPKIVISKLQIGQPTEGLDLDGDGTIDNKLSGVANLAASAITDSFKNYSVILPMEFFDMPAVVADTCVKFAIYLGEYALDTDTDGEKSAVKDGDCNDHDNMIGRGKPEVAANFKDDNCDGRADEAGAVASTDTMDRDADGQTIADGDCDDTNNKIKKGAAEICGDGLDNDCDGTGDRTSDAAGDATACSPFDATHPVDIKLDPLSFIGADPAIAFKDGTVSAEGGKLVLNAGPSLFQVSIPVADGVVLTLKVTGATIKADISMGVAGVALNNGRLAGIIDSRTADTLRGLEVEQIGLTKENSLLDATYANLLGTLLALPKKRNPDGSKFLKYPGCLTPDIDVDHDGLEAFCDSNLDDDIKTVDICIDGDGTEIVDEPGKQCSEAVDKNGKPRFIDGFSVAFTFEATPVLTLFK